jgi:predicted small secreted protein
MKTLSVLTLIVIIVFNFSGCGTIGGVGHDVSAVGRGVSNTAHAVQRAM